MITSCLECRRRKLKCNKSHPCTNCVKFTRDCVFLAPALDQASQLKLTEIKEKVGSLERLLERDVAKNSTASTLVSSNHERALPDDEEDDLPANEDEKDLEPTPLAVVDAAYEVDGEDDDLLDLGIQLGKMRITERIGGFFRPKISQEVSFPSLCTRRFPGFYSVPALERAPKEQVLVVSRARQPDLSHGLEVERIRCLTHWLTERNLLYLLRHPCMRLKRSHISRTLRVRLIGI